MLLFYRHPILSRVCSFLCLLLMTSPALARSYIRDAEVEHTLRMMSDPILLAADIEPSSVRLFMINDPTVNAFVAGGQNIFFHTGLLLEAESPSMLMGVIAHETGHIAGAHLSQLEGASNDASLGALLSYILGAAAALGGSPEAGSAILSAGQNTSLRQLLAFYRGNEQQADQAAVRYMREINLSPHGMLEMFELLRRNERQHIGPGGDAYFRTHPLSTDRIATLRGEVNKATSLPKEPNHHIQHAFARMQAKLSSFLKPTEQTFRQYPPSDTSQAAHLARAVAWFRVPDLDKALKEANALIQQSPDAFAYDLKGQILFEHGQISDAIDAYEKAHKLAPDNGLIMTDLGKAYLAQNTQADVIRAIKVLERASQLPDVNASTHRHLAVAYGKQGQLAKSYISLAREAALNNQQDNVIRYAKESKNQQDSNSVIELLADDLITHAKRIKDES